VKITGRSLVSDTISKLVRWDLKKATKHFKVDRRFPERVSASGPPEYEAFDCDVRLLNLRHYPQHTSRSVET
jgi:hypothetical protein